MRRVYTLHGWQSLVRLLLKVMKKYVAETLWLFENEIKIRTKFDIVTQNVTLLD